MSEGEKLWLCEAQAPETWVIAEKKAGKGDIDYRGLVPETFVSIDADEAELPKAQEVAMASIDEEAEADWLASARAMIERADTAPRIAAIALGDFSAETDLDIDVSEGEKLWLCQGAEAPETWVIVEKKAGKGDIDYRGLVPETYISLDAEGAVAAAIDRDASQQPAVVMADGEDAAASPGLYTSAEQALHAKTGEQAKMQADAEAAAAWAEAQAAAAKEEIEALRRAATEEALRAAEQARAAAKAEATIKLEAQRQQAQKELEAAVLAARREAAEVARSGAVNGPAGASQAPALAALAPDAAPAATTSPQAHSRAPPPMPPPSAAPPLPTSAATAGGAEQLDERARERRRRAPSARGRRRRRRGRRRARRRPARRPSSPTWRRSSASSRCCGCGSSRPRPRRSSRLR